jgi:hypothetical protein
MAGDPCVHFFFAYMRDGFGRALALVCVYRTCLSLDKSLFGVWIFFEIPCYGASLSADEMDMYRIETWMSDHGVGFRE